MASPVFNYIAEQHVHSLCDLSEVNQKLDILNRKVNHMSQTSEEVKQLVIEINDVTNEESAKVDKVEIRINQILAQLKDGMSADETADLKQELLAEVASLKAVRDRLDGLGADPENPIPPVE